MKLKKEQNSSRKGIPKHSISTRYNESLGKSIVMMSKLKGEDFAVENMQGYNLFLRSVLISKHLMCESMLMFYLSIRITNLDFIGQCSTN